MARKDTDSEIVREAQDRLNRAHEYQNNAHRHYKADMAFANGDAISSFNSIVPRNRPI